MAGIKQAKSTAQWVLLIGLSVVMVVALLLPALAGAAQATGRSIGLSSSSVSANNVLYEVKFTPASSAGAFVVDFCNDSPLTGQPCTTPAGFNATTAASETSGFTDVTGSTGEFVVAGAITANTEVAVAVTGVTNPSAAGTIYARIVTYDTKANALNYASTDLGAGSLDEGAVALAITPTIGVSGTVLESMTFCVSGQAITANCGSTTAPVLELGEQTGDVFALTSGVVSEGYIYTQITTNATSGAVVRLKSSATSCGGLIRAGAPTACDILPALNAGLDKDANEAKFGVKTADATDTAGVNANGAFVPASGSIYNNLTYAFNYASDNATGVTSAFGDPFLDTDGAPANNKNMRLTFGVTTSNSTPAGSYSTDLGLIAVGKF